MFAKPTSPNLAETQGRVSHALPTRRAALRAGAAAVALFSGCTGPLEYFRNGFKVGPNYKRPPAPVASEWIDSADERVRSTPDDLSAWWVVFNDPILNALVRDAYRQNLTLREAGFRVLQARAQFAFARGSLFPQSQTMQGDYLRNGLSTAQANRGFIPKPYYSQFDLGFGMAWELDFWGRFRRAIEAADDNLNASVESYDDVLVTLLADVASNYVQLRTIDQQLAYVRTNAQLQNETLQIARARFEGGQATDLDVEQAVSILTQTESQIPQFEIQRREANNALCVLLGIPMVELESRLGDGPIPSAPAEVAVGVPADLLRRRPDVRREERVAAAECARIGIAEADFFPAVSITGNIGWGAENVSNLFTGQSLQGTVGPTFNWKILNYGRIAANVRYQEAVFQAAVARYQQSVLQANREAEDSLIRFLRSQQQSRSLSQSVDAAQKAVQVATVQYRGGLVDFNRVATLEQNLVQQQNLLAQARSNVALGLIDLYRALGGGWQIRLGVDDRGSAADSGPIGGFSPPPEPVPILRPDAPAPPNP